MFDYWIHTEDHDFEVRNRLTGMEEVWCDRALVSKKRNFWGMATDHEFDVTEGDQVVRYVVRNAGPLGYLLRRDGKVVQRRDRPWLRLLAGMGLAFFLLDWMPERVSDLLDKEGLPLGVVMWVFVLVFFFWSKRYIQGKDPEAA